MYLSPALPNDDILYKYSTVTKLEIDIGTTHRVYSDFSISLYSNFFSPAHSFSHSLFALESTHYLNLYNLH